MRLLFCGREHRVRVPQTCGRLSRHSRHEHNKNRHHVRYFTCSFLSNLSNKNFIIRLILQWVKITDIVCPFSPFQSSFETLFSFSLPFALCQIVDCPIGGLSPGLGKKLWESERLEKLLHHYTFTLGVKEMTCTSFYLNVMKFSDWYLVQLSVCACLFVPSHNGMSLLLFLLLYLPKIWIFMGSCILYLIIITPSHGCTSLHWDLMFSLVLQSHRTSLNNIGTRDNLARTSCFYCIFNCLLLKFSLSFPFSLYVPPSQRALCHSQDPLLHVFRATVSTNERREMWN